ncbi:UDP-2,4-diacetamido-2,4,6-trideoxy-beta-L-altropyranose hydrolase [Clostridiaceae bacterium M8S5]|nr:UDP-2,4-diacetamido-2,4,6-trideoxy-beta-L-altropyranose hydrolase [Clostridiaceae bacterium M8S5]
MNVCFIASGGSKVGLGHIMRCMALASEFKKRGFGVLFFSNGSKGIKRLQENNFVIVDELTIHDIIVVDKYGLDEVFFDNLRRHCKILVYIDDTNDFDYPVDIIINGSLIAHSLGYNKYNNPNKKMLLGTKYNILRDEFRNINKIIVREKVKNIMITTGGADYYNTTSRIVNIIRSNQKYDEINLNVIIGDSFLNKNNLKNRLKEFKKIRIYENVNKISEIMLLSDIAISAGGGTIYELCACGVVTLGVILAKNQEPIVTKMDELGYIKNIGWYSDLTKNKIFNTLDILINDFEKRKNMINKQRTLVDGKGTEKIVDEVIQSI